LIPAGAGIDQWSQVDATTIALTLSDGGQFDLDGVANGVIVDPVAIGVPPVTAAASAPAASGGGGGCSLGHTNKFDPVLVMLLFLSALYLLRRRKDDDANHGAM